MTDVTNSDIDSNNDGIPDRLQQLLKDERFGPNNWENRRAVINRYLWMCGCLIGLIVCAYLTVLGFSIYRDKPVTVDPNVSTVLSTALFTLVGLAASIIGAYVFGSAWDSNSFRNSVASIALSPTSYTGPLYGNNGYAAGVNTTAYTGYGAQRSYPNSYPTAGYPPSYPTGPMTNYVQPPVGS